MSKKIFTKDKILSVAYDLSKQIGLEGLSMRKIADKAGCSVMPLYDAFISKEDLIKELSTFNEKQYDISSNTILDRYFKLLRDGLKYPKFFLNVVQYDVKHEHDEEVYENILVLLRKDIRLKNLDDYELLVLNSRIELFIIGIVYTYKDICQESLQFYPKLRNMIKETTDAMIDGYIKNR